MPGAPADLASLTALLREGRLGELLGQTETLWIDCKDSPYTLAKEWGRLELAKDASSFANADGGHILIGPKTKRLDTGREDQIVDINPLPKGLIDTQQIRDVIQDWVYPKIVDLDIAWIPYGTDPGKAVAWISIPPQGGARKPFLTKASLVDGDRIRGIAFGLCVREQSTNNPASVEDVHWAIREGQSIGSRLTAIEAKLNLLVSAGLSAVSAKSVTPGLITKRIQSLLGR